MITILFWSSLIFVLYTYAGYPFLLMAYSRLNRVDILKTSIQPPVSVVIAAYNEEKNIESRLMNILSQDYPQDRTEIIIVSDGSTDGTNAIVRRYADRNVRLVELDARQGKAVAVNHGLSAAAGEIIVFADARQRFEENAVSRLVSNFGDPTIGCVSGELVFYADEKRRIKTEMGAYWKYEKWIRKNESISGSTVGATGAIYAIRKSLFQPLPPDTILDDVLVPVNIVRQGYRCIFDADAVAFDAASTDTAQEWRRKTRTLAGNWQILGMSPWLTVPVINPCWLRFVSHKLARIIVPFALPVLLVSGAWLSGWLYLAATMMQVVLYAAAVSGFMMPATRRLRVVNLCYFFVVMNAAAVVGFWLWITGRCGSAWKTAAEVEKVKVKVAR